MEKHRSPGNPNLFPTSVRTLGGTTCKPIILVNLSKVRCARRRCPLPAATRRVQSVGGPLKRGFQFRRAETNPSGAGPYSRNHQPGLEARDKARERDRSSQSLSLSLCFEAVPSSKRGEPETRAEHFRSPRSKKDLAISFDPAKEPFLSSLSSSSSS